MRWDARSSPRHPASLSFSLSLMGSPEMELQGPIAC